MVYQTWARLNFIGKQEWGEAFPEGKVPILSIATQQVRLERIKDTESVFTVNWKELTQLQQQAILNKLSKKTGTSKEAIQKEILNTGLPIRRTLIQSVGTSQIEFLTTFNDLAPEPFKLYQCNQTTDFTLKKPELKKKA